MMTVLCEGFLGEGPGEGLGHSIRGRCGGSVYTGKKIKKLRWPGVEPGSITWKATMLTNAALQHQDGVFFS